MIDITGIFSESFWYMAPILASLTVTLTGAINGKFNITSGIWPQVVSWVVGSLLAVGSWLLGLVSLGEPTWVSIIALCACIGLSSNGIYDIPAIKDLIDKWFKVLPKK